MRILIANDRFDVHGGVQSYLESVVPGLRSRAHDIAMLSTDVASAGPQSQMPDVPHFTVAGGGTDQALAAARHWRPDICFSHNVADADVDRRLLDLVPVVKFVHAYEATCVSGRKMFDVPVARPCDRRFGLACTALYFPRRCGGLSVPTMVQRYRLTRARHALLTRYPAITVLSAHMKRECVKHGVDDRKVHVMPYFSSVPVVPELEAQLDLSVIFAGRMTSLKGGGLLIRAVADASRRLEAPIQLTMLGDGSDRAGWERLAAGLNLSCTFPGWQHGDARLPWFERASLLAVPSVWPEPYGLVGPEAAAAGVPAIAFDVGGIREWLTPGENGYLVPADPPTARAFADGLVAAFRRPDELRAMRRRTYAAARRFALPRHLDVLEETLSSCSR